MSYLYQRDLTDSYLQYSQVCPYCLDHINNNKDINLILKRSNNDLINYNLEDLYGNKTGFVFKLKKYEKVTQNKIFEIYVKCMKCEKRLFSIEGFDIITETLLEDYFKMLFSIQDIHKRIFYDDNNLLFKSLFRMKISLLELYHYHLYGKYYPNELKVLNIYTNPWSDKMRINYENIDKNSSEYYIYSHKQKEFIDEFSKRYNYLDIYTIFNDLLFHNQMIKHVFTKYSIDSYNSEILIKNNLTINLIIIMEEIFKRIFQLNYFYTNILFEKYFTQKFKNILNS